MTEKYPERYQKRSKMPSITGENEIYQSDFEITK
jgi:hypothetical protein